MQIAMPEKKTPSTHVLPLLAVALVLAAAAGYAYWHYSGRIILEGRLQSNAVLILARSAGLVTAIDAAQGQHVRKGDVLLRFDDAPLRRALAEEEQKLAQVRQLIPPELLRVPVSGRADGRADEAMTERLERQRADEGQAERMLQEATDAEAQAAVLYSRATMLAAKKKITLQERDAAEAALAAARRDVQSAREYFESVSLARAATGTDIRRIRDAQTASGASRLPVDMRMDTYLRQAERVAAARAALDSAFLLAPADGVIVDVAVKPGDTLETARPCFLFRPSGRPPMIRALVAEDTVVRLGVGQQCRISLEGPQEIQSAGYIAALLPDLSGQGLPGPGANTAVWVTAESSGPGGQLFTLADNTKATITVLLREPLYAVGGNGYPDSAASAGSVGPSSGQTAGTHEGVAPAAPQAAGAVSVQSPFGEDPAVTRERQAQMPVQHAPPVVRAGTPEAAGRAPEGAAQPTPPPQLPPMQAPEQLIGSPLPDPRNNPSLITPEILENAASAPR